MFARADRKHYKRLGLRDCESETLSATTSMFLRRGRQARSPGALCGERRRGHARTIRESKKRGLLFQVARAASASYLVCRGLCGTAAWADSLMDFGRQRKRAGVSSPRLQLFLGR